MIPNALKKIWLAATANRRSKMIANALNILSEDYEAYTGVPAKAMLTSEGVDLEISFEVGKKMGSLEFEYVKELSPQAYTMLRKARAFEVSDVTLTRHNTAKNK
jgi:hypothetical protein